MWISNKIAVAAKGTARPARRLPVAFEITPTTHGNTAGPSDAKENITEPMLRAPTPKRCEKRATVMGYKVAKLNPVTSAAAMTPGRVDEYSIRPIPAVAAAKPASSTRRSGRCFRIRLAEARPNISADQKKAGIMGPMAAPRDPMRATYEPIQPPTAVSAPGNGRLRTLTANSTRNTDTAPRKTGINWCRCAHATSNEQSTAPTPQ